MAKQIHVYINAIHSKTGGGLVYLNNILPELAASGLRLTVLATKGYEDRIDLPEGVDLKVFNVPKNFLKMHFWEQFTLPRLLKGELYDVMLCNANYVPIFAKNTLPIIHNNPSVGMVDKRFKSIVYWKILIGLTRLSLVFSPKAFIVVEHMIPQYASGLFSSLKRKILVAHPACVNIERPSRVEKQDFLAVGDFYIQKNYPFLIDAFAAFKEKVNFRGKLVIVGHPVDKQVYKDTVSHIKFKGLEDDVEIVQGLPHEALLGLMQKSETYLNASLVESFNMPVLEAMAAGTAVILSNHSFQKEVGGNAVCYVPWSENTQENLMAWVNAMVNLHTDEKLRFNYEIKGAKRVGQFNWKKTASIMVDAIKGL